MIQTNIGQTSHTTEHERYLGWRFLAYGWLGPVALSFAWYANIPLALCMIRMARGIAPNFLSSSIALFLALTVFIRAHHLGPMNEDHVNSFSGPGVYFGLVAFIMTWAMALRGKIKN